MSDASDIAMTECRLFRENGRSHFMTRRFDRLKGGDKVHKQSLCGMAHFDFNDSGAYSYEQAIGIMRDLKLSAAEIEQFFVEWFLMLSPEIRMITQKTLAS